MPSDPLDDALRVLAEYVDLPFSGRRLVSDAGSPRRVRADARNRRMMERVLLDGSDYVFRLKGVSGVGPVGGERT